MKDLFAKYALPTFLSILGVFAPIKGAIITVGIVIAVDLITGILAARKRGEVISSKAYSKTIGKMIKYQTALLTGYLIEKYLIGGLLPISSVVTTAIGIGEAISLYENLNVLTDNKIFGGLVGTLKSLSDVKPKDGDSKEPPK